MDDVSASDDVSKFLELAKKRFKLCMDADSKERDLQADDLRFLNGDQWPERIKAMRQETAQGSAPQPCLVINRIPAYTRQVENDLRHVRPSIKVRGVDSQSDPKTAETLNGMIRAICGASDAKSAFTWGGKYAIDIGQGYWKINTCYEHPESFDQIIEIQRIKNRFSVFLDPYRKKQDGSDSKYGFIIENMDPDEFEAKYPNATSEWHDDDKTYPWFTHDAIRVAEYWVIEEKKKTIYKTPFGVTDVQPTILIDGEELELPAESRETVIPSVKQYIITGAEILEEHEWAGKYIPIVEVSGDELDIEGETHRKGVVRDLKDPQRNYNYHKSAIVERVALTPKAPYIGAKGQFKDPKWNQANVKNFAYLEYEPVPGAAAPQRTAPPEVSPGLTQELVSAAEEMNAVSGMHKQRMGDGAVSSSGRAVNAWKVQSEIGTFHYIDNFALAMRHTGRILVDLIPKIYTSERMTAILEPSGEQKNVIVNGAGIPLSGMYDTVVDIGPSYATQRQEASETMLELVQYFPNAAPIIGDILAKNMDWPGAEEIANRLKLLLPQEILANEMPAVKQVLQKVEQEKAQMGQMIQMLQTQLEQATLALTDKQKENQIKEAEVSRKRRKDEMDTATDLTKLELEHRQNVPGALI